jgi:hypothetical protein
MRPMKKAGLATGGLQKAFPRDLPRRTGKQIGNAKGIIVGVHDRQPSRLIKALKSTGRRRFALRAVASCRLGERQKSATNF